MNIFDIFKKFDNNENAIKCLENIRWKDGVICPYCNSDKTCKHTEKNKSRWQCWGCNKSFSVTVGTIFHHSHIELNKWFMLITLMLNAKKSLSACQAARNLEMHRPIVWSMMHRIRAAMATEQVGLLTGVEMDETYIGGKPRKSNDKDNDTNNTGSTRGRGTKKTPVVGMVEREGNVKAQSVSKHELKGKDLEALVRKNIDTENSVLVTDEYKAYNNMHKIIEHFSINHSREYTRGNIHTNTIESF
jgi:transposase-like protein